jgi:4-hydroxybenzoate polyprenyltransferase
MLVVIGISVASVAQKQNLWNPGDILGVVVITIAFACAWLFAVGTNDLADTTIDAMTNTDRPLVTGSLSAGDIRSANIVFLIWAMIGGFILGYWTLFLIACFTAAYYVYSVPPLRLKRVPILASFLISLACLSAAMAGFFFVSSTKLVSDFPKELALIIIITFTLGANIKDVKDIEGDRADGVMTLPTVFGEKHGVALVGILLGFSFLVVPAVFRLWILLIPSAIAAIFGYWTVVVRPYREWRVFGIYFLYTAVVLGILILGK